MATYNPVFLQASQAEIFSDRISAREVSQDAERHRSHSTASSNSADIALIESATHEDPRRKSRMKTPLSPEDVKIRQAINYMRNHGNGDDDDTYTKQVQAINDDILVHYLNEGLPHNREWYKQLQALIRSARPRSVSFAGVAHSGEQRQRSKRLASPTDDNERPQKRQDRTISEPKSVDASNGTASRFELDNADPTLGRAGPHCDPTPSPLPSPTLSPTAGHHRDPTPRLPASHDEVQRATEKARSDMERLKNKIEAQESSNRRLNAELRLKDSRISNLRDSIEIQESKINQLTVEMNDLRQRPKADETHVHQLKQQLQEKSAAMTQQAQAFQDAIASLQHEASKLRSSAHAEAAAHSQAQQKILYDHSRLRHQHSEQLREKIEENSRLESEISTLRKEISVLKAEIRALLLQNASVQPFDDWDPSEDDGDAFSADPPPSAPPPRTHTPLAMPQEPHASLPRQSPPPMSQSPPPRPHEQHSPPNSPTSSPLHASQPILRSASEPHSRAMPSPRSGHELERSSVTRSQQSPHEETSFTREIRVGVENEQHSDEIIKESLRKPPTDVALRIRRNTQATVRADTMPEGQAPAVIAPSSVTHGSARPSTSHETPSQRIASPDSRTGDATDVESSRDVIEDEPKSSHVVTPRSESLHTMKPSQPTDGASSKQITADMLHRRLETLRHVPVPSSQTNPFVDQRRASMSGASNVDERPNSSVKALIEHFTTAGPSGTGATASNANKAKDITSHGKRLPQSTSMTRAAGRQEDIAPPHRRMSALVTISEKESLPQEAEDTSGETQQDSKQVASKQAGEDPTASNTNIDVTTLTPLQSEKPSASSEAPQSDADSNHSKQSIPENVESERAASPSSSPLEYHALTPSVLQTSHQLEPYSEPVTPQDVQFGAIEPGNQLPPSLSPPQPLSPFSVPGVQRPIPSPIPSIPPLVGAAGSVASEEAGLARGAKADLAKAEECSPAGYVSTIEEAAVTLRQGTREESAAHDTEHPRAHAQQVISGLDTSFATNEQEHGATAQIQSIRNAPVAAPTDEAVSHARIPELSAPLFPSAFVQDDYRTTFQDAESLTLGAVEGERAEAKPSSPSPDATSPAPKTRSEDVELPSSPSRSNNAHSEDPKDLSLLSQADIKSEQVGEEPLPPPPVHSSPRRGTDSLPYRLKADDDNAESRSSPLHESQSKVAEAKPTQDRELPQSRNVQSEPVDEQSLPLYPSQQSHSEKSILGKQKTQNEPSSSKAGSEIIEMTNPAQNYGEAEDRNQLPPSRATGTPEDTDNQPVPETSLPVRSPIESDTTKAQSLPARSAAASESLGTASLLSRSDDAAKQLERQSITYDSNVGSVQLERQSFPSRSDEQQNLSPRSDTGSTELEQHSPISRSDKQQPLSPRSDTGSTELEQHSPISRSDEQQSLSPRSDSGSAQLEQHSPLSRSDAGSEVLEQASALSRSDE